MYVPVHVTDKIVNVMTYEIYFLLKKLGCTLTCHNNDQIYRGKEN